MENIKQKLERIAISLHIRKGKIVSLVFATIAVVVFILDATLFHGQLKALFWGFDGLMLVFFLASMVLVAGLVVVRSLFHVAAGLSLLIFLAQSYCASSGLTVTSNNALKGLMIIGLVYIASDFAKTIYFGLKENLKSVSEVKSRLEKILIVFLFIAFAFIFVLAVYQVVDPIITSFCVYK
jgi:hypothetical protein